MVRSKLSLKLRSRVGLRKCLRALKMGSLHGGCAMGQTCESPGTGAVFVIGSSLLIGQQQKHFLGTLKVTDKKTFAGYSSNTCLIQPGSTAHLSLESQQNPSLH
jgi:hypothetical protein